jgi:hypothetical protein
VVKAALVVVAAAVVVAPGDAVVTWPFEEAAEEMKPDTT